jgi:hypothetical protein
MIRVDEKLNIVISVADEDGQPAFYVYSAPISREVFEANFRILSLTYAEITGQDSSYLSVGIRCAALTLKDVAASEAARKGRQGDGGAAALLAEIKRLTTILAPSQGGWDTLPVPDAVRSGVLTDEEWSEVESAIVFFTGAYWLAPGRRRKEVVTALCSMLDWQATSSLPSEFAAGLPTSKPGASPKMGASSVPS